MTSRPATPWPARRPRPVTPRWLPSRASLLRPVRLPQPRRLLLRARPSPSSRADIFWVARRHRRASRRHLYAVSTSLFRAIERDVRAIDQIGHLLADSPLRDADG